MILQKRFWKTLASRKYIFGNKEIVLFDWNNQCFYHQVSLYHKPSPVGLLCDQNNNWHNELKSFLKKHFLIYVSITPLQNISTHCATERGKDGKKGIVVTWLVTPTTPWSFRCHWFRSTISYFIFLLTE